MLFNLSFQIRDLLWSGVNRELVSGEMTSSNNVRLWRYPDLQPVATIDAHLNGVLQLAVGPDGTNLGKCSAAGPGSC